MKKRDEKFEERLVAFFRILRDERPDEATFDDDYNLEPEKKIPSGRKSVVPMCLTVREKEEFESVTARYIKEARCHIPSKSAFLRYLWRYFLKNRDDIDLSEYVD